MRQDSRKPAARDRPVRGAVLELELTAMALDGDAVGHAGSYVLLVPEGIPGERVVVEVVSAGRKSGKARIRRILAASPHRVTPPCRHFGPCGGCAWQHIAYEEQLSLKRQMLIGVFQRALAGHLIPVLPAAGIPEPPAGAGPERRGPWGYRNKTHFAFGQGPGGKGLVMGHYRRGSRDLLSVEECPVHSPEGNRLSFRARDGLRRQGVEGVREDTLQGLGRHILVRVSEGTGETQVTLVATSDAPGLRTAAGELAALKPPPDGIHLSINDRPGPYILGSTTRKLHGQDRLVEEVAGARFALSPRTFFQTNVRSARVLVEAVLRRVPAGSREPVIDLYAGAGLFAIPLALRGNRVIAVEESPGAVSDGIASLALNPVPPGACRFERARVEDWVRRDASRADREGTRAKVVVLDPPREGCPREALESIIEGLRPERLVYVSCNPRALASDLAIAIQAGYRVSEVEPVDMFPHTAHIEAVALLLRD